MQRLPVAALSLLILPAAGAAPAMARTPGCRSGDAPVIVVRFAGAKFDAAFRRAVLANLRAPASDRGFAVCDDDPGPGRRQVASIVLAAGEARRVAVAIEVQDAVTAKRLSREVDLTGFPADARALGLAVACDELLRASWMELALAHGRRRGSAEPPLPQVARVVSRALEQSRSRPNVIGVAFAVDGYTGGERHLGGELFVGRWLLPWLSLEAGFGARRGLARSSRNGEITATAMSGQLGLLFQLPRRRLSLVGGAGLRVAGVEFSGQPAPGAVARHDGGVAVIARARAGARLRVGPLVLRLLAGAGVPLVGLAARDDGETVTAVEGIELFGQLGVEVPL